MKGIERPFRLYRDIKSVVKERVHSGWISIKHLRTNSLVVYPLNKALTPKVFHEHILIWVFYSLRNLWISGSYSFLYVYVLCFLFMYAYILIYYSEITLYIKVIILISLR
ncbi:hypothetical protein V8G54_019109 [Vigna mungo]|uniref:Uncharacterized protein n=1 Tax=Vigna mungo TaxID=3915 RepID=A0AAQ3RUL8_VIGMU